jgi:hypothetical protein
MRSGKLGQKQRSKFVLSDEQLEKEKAFAVYRGMGRRRTLGILVRGLLA